MALIQVGRRSWERKCSQRRGGFSIYIGKPLCRPSAASFPFHGASSMRRTQQVEQPWPTSRARQQIYQRESDINLCQTDAWTREGTDTVYTHSHKVPFFGVYSSGDGRRDHYGALARKWRTDHAQKIHRWNKNLTAYLTWPHLVD